MAAHPWLDRPVAEFSHAVLTHASAWVSRVVFEIVVHAQAKSRVTLVGESRTIVLAPKATLRELLVASRLLALLSRKDRWKNLIVQEVQRNARFLRLAERRLAERFPGYVLGDMDTLASSMELRWSSARVEEVQQVPIRRSRRGPDHWQTSGTRFVLTSCRWAGLVDPLQALEAKIRAGEVPLETLPDFADVPFFVAEVRVSARGGGQASPEQLQRIGIVPGIVASYGRCLRRNAEGRDELTPPETASHVGLDLLEDRLADVRVAMHSRQSIPVFASTEDAPPRFQPERYLAGVYFDLDGLAFSGVLAKRQSPRFVASILRVYQELGIRTFARAHVDRWIKRSGKPVLLRIEFVLQDGTEPWSGALWERLEFVLAHARGFAGDKAHFTPLSLARMATEFRALVKPERDPLLMLLLTEAFYHERPPEVVNADARFAAALDRMAARLHRKVAPLRSAAFLLPQPLVAKLDPSGRVRPGCVQNRA